MSISFKKINSMIEVAVSELGEKDESYKKIVERMCTKIYRMETVSVDKQTHVVKDIKGEITRAVNSIEG